MLYHLLRKCDFNLLTNDDDDIYDCVETSNKKLADFFSCSRIRFILFEKLLWQRFLRKRKTK